MKQSYYDPYSLRDVSISEPRLGRYLFDEGWFVCVEANAKNRLGGYVGLTMTAYVISKGAVSDSLSGQGICDNVAMTPWPEMESGGRDRN